MRAYRDILFETPKPFVARITLNRPERMNAYTGAMCDDLVAAFAHYAGDDSLRCLIMTGAGRGFCSGGDISGNASDHPDYRTKQLGYAHEMRVGMHRVIATLHRLDKPVIAMINGAAVAGGLTLALACDFRIAAQSASLGDTSGRFGLLPDEGGAWFFPRMMGLDRALKMSLLHEVYPASEALALGLVTDVVPDVELTDRTFELAARIARQVPLAVRLTKSMMRHGLDAPLDHALNDAAFAVMIANPSADAREGVRAFLDRREPDFEGR